MILLYDRISSQNLAEQPQHYYVIGFCRDLLDLIFSLEPSEASNKQQAAISRKPSVSFLQNSLLLRIIIIITITTTTSFAILIMLSPTKDRRLLPLLLALIFVTAACSVSRVRSEDSSSHEARPPHTLPGVVRLADATFEHATQASTGQTTGSWLVWFYQDDDRDDSTTIVEGSFPSESEWLEDHIVLGAVNVVQEGGQKVKERFGIRSDNLPVFLYFHKGRLYRVPKNAGVVVYSWDAVRSFCRNPDPSLAELIPAPPNFWADLLTGIREHKNYPVLLDAGTYYVMVLAGLVVFLVVGLFVKAVMGHFGQEQGGKEKRA